MKKYLTNNILYKIVSVIFAIVLWIIVLNLNDPSTTRTIKDIPVTIENENAIIGQDMVYKIIAGNTASVTVTGPRSIVDKMSANDIKATADFQQLSQTNAVPIKVELRKQYNSRETVTLTNNTFSMRLDIEQLEAKEFDIVVRNVGDLADNYVIYESKLSKKKVTVTAPTSVMNTIADVVAVVQANENSENFEKEVKLVCVDYGGREIKPLDYSIQMNFTRVKVKNIVYFSKEVTISDDFDGVIPEEYAIISREYSKDKVVIVGKKEIVDTIGKVVIPAQYLKFDENKSDYEIECLFNNVLPEGVESKDKDATVIVKMHIDKQAQKSYSVDVKKVALTNIPEGYEASIITKGIVVYSLSGLSEALIKYEAQEIYNVSLEGLGEGTHDVKVIIEIDEGLVVTRDAYIRVSLKKSNGQSNREETTSSEKETTTRNNDSEQETTTTASLEDPDEEENGNDQNEEN